MDDDELPRPKRRWVEPVALEPVSVEDLREYVAALRAEIGRVESAIEGKQSHRSAAEKFFKSGG